MTNINKLVIHFFKKRERESFSANVDMICEQIRFIKFSNQSYHLRQNQCWNIRTFLRNKMNVVFIVIETLVEQILICVNTFIWQRRRRLKLKCSR